MEAFLTGSHAYGKPHSESDVDLVVYMEKADFNKLHELLKEHRILKDGVESYPSKSGKGDECPSISLRLGPLNLIAVSDYETYEVWKQGTEDLKKIAKVGGHVTRDEAVEKFASLFNGLREDEWGDVEPHPKLTLKNVVRNLRKH